LACLVGFHYRLRTVQIEDDDALNVIKRYNTDKTFYYVDPPYVPSARKDPNLYQHEVDEEYHERLVDLLLQVKGKVMLSGYPNPIYERLERAGWVRVDRETASYAVVRSRATGVRGEGSAMRKARRVEAIWMNYNPPLHSQIEMDMENPDEQQPND